MIRNFYKKRNIVTITLIIIFLFSQNGYSQKINNQHIKNAYIIILNRFTLTDIEKMPNVKKLIDDGSVGLMNTRGANGYDGPQGYATINSSKRASADYESGLFFNINLRTKYSYKRKTGQDLYDSKVVNTDINYLINLNKDIEFSPFIGALGENLHSSGYKTAVFGNSDTAHYFDRTNCLIATDAFGRIDYGNVDDILILDEEFCYGYRTDYEKVYNELTDVIDKAHLIVIETGDLNRLSSCKDKMSTDMFLVNRNKVLSKIDDFIGALIDSIEKHRSLVFIVSPNREEKSISDSRLSPIIVWGLGVKNGIVTSGTTRRDGLISNIDIAPTITSFLGASNDNFIGQPIISKDQKMNFKYVKELSQNINSTSLIRNEILKTYNFFVIIGSLIILGFLVFRNKLKRNYFKVIKYILLCIIGMPLGFLLISLIDANSYFVYFLIILLFVLILSIILIKIGYKYSFLVITGIITITITIDLLTEGKLIKSSVLGYDPIIGARYFGIGNELLGVLIGNITIFCGIYLEIFKRHYYILFVLAVIIISVLHPDLGANFGGSIALILMSLIFIIQVFNIKINLKTIVSLMILIGSIFSIVIFLDAFININPSHLGNTLRITIYDNPFYIFEIISRKLSMNIRLIGITIWSKTLFFSLLYMFLNLLIFKDIIKTIFTKNRFLTAGFISALTGSLIGLLVNDSGIIMAGIGIIYIVNYLIYGTIIEVEKIR